MGHICCKYVWLHVRCKSLGVIIVSLAYSER